MRGRQCTCVRRWRSEQTRGQPQVHGDELARGAAHGGDLGGATEEHRPHQQAGPLPAEHEAARDLPALAPEVEQAPNERRHAIMHAVAFLQERDHRTFDAHPQRCRLASRARGRAARQQKRQGFVTARTSTDADKARENPLPKTSWTVAHPSDSVPPQRGRGIEAPWRCRPRIYEWWAIRLKALQPFQVLRDAL